MTSRMNLDNFRIEGDATRQCIKGQELRKSALQGCKAYGLGSQWTVPRIGYEIKDRNSG
tara:strand:+ start:3295 stop:3471 length:177 start_codon:yes stop_codon:yes gene_type:complete